MHRRLFELPFHPWQLLLVVIRGRHRFHSIHFPIGLEDHGTEDEVIVGEMFSR